MELYIDESGNTGCVISRNGTFNFDKQRHFVLCAIKVENDEDKIALIQKYLEFKRYFNIEDEIKGSDLMTRKYNLELEYFIENILDDKHFEVCIYDKKFYLSTLLLLFLLGNEFQSQFPVEFYHLASELSFHCDDLLMQYCDLVKKPTPEMFEQLLKAIIAYQYKEIPNINNPLILFSEHILKDGNYALWLDDILSYESYENPNYVNVINLNCLSELILTMKYQENLLNDTLSIYHDKIDGYDKTFLSELQFTNIDISFVDSKKEELVQLADNAVSVFAKCINEVTQRFKLRKEWEADSQWIMEQYAKVINKVTINNVKFTIPIQNWAVSLCIKDMFRKEYPIQRRRNIYFNQYYSFYISRIISDLNNKDFNAQHMLDILKQ